MEVERTNEDLHLDNFYEEYYSQIDIRQDVEPIAPPRRSQRLQVGVSHHCHQASTYQANIVQPRSFPETKIDSYRSKLTNALKKFALNASIALKKTKTHRSTQFQSFSVRAMPTHPSAQSVTVQTANHRRVVSVQRALPTPPMERQVTQHRRRPTAGPREMPDDLKNLDGIHFFL